MDPNSRIDREINLPFYLKFLKSFIDLLPNINSPLGIVGFTFTIIIIFSVVRCLYTLIIGNSILDDDEVENKTIKKDIVNTEFYKRIEEERKRRSEEANKLLERVNKVK